MKYYTVNDKKLEEKDAIKFILDYYDAIKKKGTRYADMTNMVKEGYVLDYGCGWGCFSKIISEKGNKVLGIDIDKNSIEIAKSIIQEDDNLKFEMRDTKGIDDETFDYVISTQVLEHTHNPGNYLMECNRVLKKGGYLIISVPNIININHVLSQLVLSKKKLSRINSHDYSKPIDHIQSWNPATLCMLLKSMGFAYEEHKLSEGMPISKHYLRGIKIPVFHKLCYTMIFKFRKERFVRIENSD